MAGHSLETGSPLSSRGRQATNEVVTVCDMDNLIRWGWGIEDAEQSANNPSPVEAEDLESSGIQRGRGTAYGGENPSAEAVQSVGKSSSVEVEYHLPKLSNVWSRFCLSLSLIVCHHTSVCLLVFLCVVKL